MQFRTADSRNGNGGATSATILDRAMERVVDRVRKAAESEALLLLGSMDKVASVGESAAAIVSKIVGVNLVHPGNGAVCQ